MTDHNLIERIKKLLALANNNFNEAEAAQAMALANKLVMKHGISEDQLKDGSQAPRVGYGERFEYKDRWHIVIAQGVGLLYGTRSVLWNRDSMMAFAGRSLNNEASELTYSWLILQVEKFYKDALPSGMTQKARADFRADFKLAAAQRLYYRMVEMSEVDPKGTGTDLVLYNHKEQLNQEVEDFFSADGVRKARSTAVRKFKDADAVRAGRIAGGAIDIHRSVKH